MQIISFDGDRLKAKFIGFDLVDNLIGNFFCDLEKIIADFLRSSYRHQVATVESHSTCIVGWFYVRGDMSERKHFCFANF